MPLMKPKGVFLPKILASSVALCGVSLVQQNGLAKSSSNTADMALRPDDMVLKKSNIYIHECIFGVQI